MRGFFFGLICGRWDVQAWPNRKNGMQSEPQFFRWHFFRMPMWSLDAFILEHGAHSRIRVVWNVAVKWPNAWVVGIKCDLDN